MKKKQLKDLTEKAQKEIEKELFKKKQSLLEAVVNTMVGQEKNVKKVKMLKKDIAQILTVLKEKEAKEKQIKKQETKEKTK